MMNIELLNAIYALDPQLIDLGIDQDAALGGVSNLSTLDPLEAIYALDPQLIEF